MAEAEQIGASVVKQDAPPLLEPQSAEGIAEVEERLPERQYCVFRTGRERFCVSVLDVEEVVEWPSLTRVPLAPAFLMGIFNLRGAIVPIIDIAFTEGRRADLPPRHVVVASLNPAPVQDLVETLGEFSRALTMPLESLERRLAPRLREHVRDTRPCPERADVVRGAVAFRTDDPEADFSAVVRRMEELAHVRASE